MFSIDRTKSLRRKLAEGKSYDEALAELRTEGVSILECIGAVKRFRGCELSEAKRIIHSSPAWSDVGDPLNRELEDLAKRCEDENRKQADC